VDLRTVRASGRSALELKNLEKAVRKKPMISVQESKLRKRQKCASSPSRAGRKQPEKGHQPGVPLGPGFDIVDVRHDEPLWKAGTA
jgi:hypothetical protein